MGLSYCTPTDVANVAVKYRDQIQGIAGQATTISTAQMDVLIADASDRVRMMFQPRYTVERIDAMDPDFPPLVVTATKIQAAIYLYDRFGSKNIDTDQTIIAQLRRDLQQCERVFSAGLLQTVLGTYVETDMGIILSPGNTSEAVTEVFNAPRY